MKILRKNIKNSDIKKYLTYGIRDIIVVVNEIKSLDKNFKITSGENIGDPIAKGHKPPSFLNALIKKYADKNCIYGYVDSMGVMEAREFVAEQSKKFYKLSALTPDDVIFFSGLGQAINTLYMALPKNTYGICPSPGYPTHNSTNSFHAGKKIPQYRLDPRNSWQPDLKDLENKIKRDKNISFILVINPNNPTGAVYTRLVLRKIADLAKKYRLFIISDEIYFNMVYNRRTHTHMHEIVEKSLPLIVMRGTSKDIPWPGGRSGWIEIYNQDKDKSFAEYIDGIKQYIRMQVCSTALPQYLTPLLYRHRDFPAYLKKQNKEQEQATNEICDMLNEIHGISCDRACGAFYLMPVFDKGKLNKKQTLPIASYGIRKYIEKKVKEPGFALDKRFCYYLLASEGIVAVPASDFGFEGYGFRVTTLEKNQKKRKDTYKRLKIAVEEYLKSA